MAGSLLFCQPHPIVFLSRGTGRGPDPAKTFDFLVAQMVKRLSTMRETLVQSLGREDPLEKEMATHSSTIAWEIPWTEEPGGLQCTGRRESDTTE